MGLPLHNKFRCNFIIFCAVQLLIFIFVVQLFGMEWVQLHSKKNFLLLTPKFSINWASRTEQVPYIRIGTLFSSASEVPIILPRI
jgi:hypothetical protein